VNFQLLLSCLILSGLGAVFALVTGIFLFSSQRKKQAVFSFVFCVLLFTVFLFSFREFLQRMETENDEYLKQEHKDGSFRLPVITPLPFI
jgi:membrane protein implicated in regulation of membrane protease activity